MKKKIIIAAGSLAIVAIAAVIVVLKMLKVDWDYNLNVPKEFAEYQDYWLMGGVMSCEQGNYIISWNGAWKILSYYSPEQKSAEIVCTEANCKHRDENCKAVFDSIKANGFQYCNGYIFYKQREENQEVWLYRCKTDGSERTRLMMLADNKEVREIQDLYVHKNHVIVNEIMSDGHTEKLVDYDMEGLGKYGKGKTIAQRQFNSAGYFVLSVKDDKMLYKQISGNKLKVHEYNLNSGADEIVLECDSTSANVKYYKDGFIVSEAGKAEYICKGEETEICNDASKYGPWISYDNKNIYAFYENDKDEKYVAVYDEAFKEKARIDCKSETEGIKICYFSDGNNLIIGSGDMKKLSFYNADDLAKGEVKLHIVKVK